MTHPCQSNTELSVAPYRILVSTLVAIWITTSGTSAKAENLVHVGRIDPIAIKLYADKDSVSRRADISQIKAVVIPDPTKKTVETLQMAFDCSDKTYSTSETSSASIEKAMTWEKGSERFSIASETIKGIFGIACKKSYEFWK